MSYTPEQIIHASTAMMERAGWKIEQTGDNEWRVTSPVYASLHDAEDMARLHVSNPFTDAKALDQVLESMTPFELIEYHDGLEANRDVARYALMPARAHDSYELMRYWNALVLVVPVQTRAECAARAMGILPEVKA